MSIIAFHGQSDSSGSQPRRSTARKGYYHLNVTKTDQNQDSTGFFRNSGERVGKGFFCIFINNNFQDVTAS